jgi:hypothetical protein
LRILDALYIPTRSPDSFADGAPTALQRDSRWLLQRE